MAKITSNALTFVDTTDSRKFEAHISSNLPQVQIYDQNSKTYSPDWSKTTLNLQSSIYLDSTDITTNTGVTIEWYKNSISTATKIGNGNTLTINTNVLSTEPIITYICQAKYQNLTTSTRIDYTRIDSGVNGSSGTSAPAVQAQYSVDGTAWTATLNAATHKYIRHSYDGGKTWTTAIKMVGEDGKSVAIKGTATSVTAVSGTDYYTVTYGGSSISTATLGDSYLYGGDLYVCSELRDDADYFINVGKIQGAKGNDGESSYVYIRYATSSSGANMTASPSSQTTYIGIHVSSATTAPTTASSYTWSKFVGDSAKSIILSGDSQVFKVSKSNAYTPTTINVTAQSINTSVTTWTYNINDGKGFVSAVPTGVSRNGNVVTITGSTLTTDSIVIKASDGSIEDVFTVYKAFDGTNGNPGTPGTPASMAFLTNENVTFGANASGQILATSFSTNVVAYSGTTKTTPTIGTISGLPTGMTASIGTAVNNEIPIVFTIANNSTLGSASNNNGSITIPVNGPVYTNLILTWSKVNSGAKGDKGDKGVSIKSTTVAYGTSDSASTLPIDTAWQSTIPTVAEGKYLWTRTIIDYTDDAIADTVTYTYAKQGTKGDTGSSGSSVTVSSIQYQEGVSATTTPTGTWSNSVVSVAEGKYLWTKTAFSDGKIAYGVAKQGVSGKDGVGINSTTVNYGSSDSSTVKPTVWYSDIPAVEDGKYLWTRTVTDYTDTSKADTVTYVYAKQGTKGDTGSSGTSVTVKSIKYQSGTSATTAPTGTWSDSVVAVAEGNYLWTQTTFSDNKVAYGVAKQGAKGSTGTPASIVSITPSAYYFKSTTGKDGTFTPDYIYLYPRFQTVTFSKWEYSINGGTTWVAASGANGLTISTYNSIANTLRIAKTSTLYTDTVTSISFRCVSSNASVYDTVSIAKIYDVVDLQIGGRNYILNSANLSVSGLGSSNGSRMEYKYINVGQSYMNIASGTEVTISFDLEMTVNTANPTLLIYNTNQKGPKTIANKTLQFTAAVGETIKQRCSVTTMLTDRADATLTHNCLEFYSTYETYNWFKISNLKLEVGNKATDWSPAPEDLKSTTFQLYAPKGYLITNDVPTVTLETFAYDGSQQITGATFSWYRWNGEAWAAISGTTGASLTLNKSNVLKSSVYKCEMTYSGKVYEATATVEDKTDVYDSLIHITSKYSSTNRLYWVLYSTVYSEEGERDELLGPIGTTAPSSPTTGSYWYKVDETNYTVTLMKYSGTAWATTTDKQELVYDWFLLNDVDKMITLGAQSKVKIVTANDFSRTCSVQCNVSDAELILLTHNNQILTDPSDPIISATVPTNPINGQLWIKTNENGSYVLSVWDSASEKWVVSEADTQNKVYVTKPTQYNTGDLWIVDSNYQPVAYDNGVAQTYKHTEKTMLRAIATSQTYSDAHWVEALKYQKEIDNVIEDVEKFKQFMSIDDTGLIMQAKGANGTVSDFKTVLTNTELGFYQGASRVAYINNNQLNISKAEITNGMVVGGTTPELQIGNFVLIQESNGSLSIGLKS